MSQDIKQQIDHIQIVQNEIDLILACCRVNQDAIWRVRVQSMLQNSLDWDWILSSVTCHGVLPLLYHSLSAVHFLNVPESVRKKLQEANYINFFRNEELLALMHSLVDMCNKKNIKILSFKGPLLSTLIYGEIGFRQISDLDFLVKYDDARAVKELILSQGYHINFDGMKDNYARDGYTHLSFYHPQRTTIRLDFQWCIGRRYSYYRFDMNKVWNRVAPVKIGDNTYAAISHEDLLLLLSMHGNNHAWEKLKWICDISELMQKMVDDDWHGICQQARDAGILRILLSSVALAARLFHLNIPDELRHRIERDRKTTHMVDSLQMQLFANKKFPAKTWSRKLFVMPANLAYQVQSRESYFDQCRYIYYCYRPNLRKLIPTAKDKKLRLPRFLHFVYFLIRPFRLFLVYAPKLVREKMKR